MKLSHLGVGVPHYQVRETTASVSVILGKTFKHGRQHLQAQTLHQPLWEGYRCAHVWVSVLACMLAIGCYSQ